MKMIRREQSISGKNEAVASCSAATNAPLTVLRPVTVLSGSPSTPSLSTNSSGSPVVLLLTSPGNVRLSTPPQPNGSNSQQSSKVFVLQLPPKSNSTGTPTISTSQPQKIIATPSAPNNVILKRPQTNQLQISPNNISQVFLTRTDGSSPPVKRLAINGPGVPMIRPVIAQSSALPTHTFQHVAQAPAPVASSSPSGKLVSASKTKRGANLARLEQARSAVRACAAESLPTSHSESPSSSSPAVAQRPSPMEVGLTHCINFDKAHLSKQTVPPVRLHPWTKLSEAVMSLLPYHLYDTNNTPAVDILEHDLAFAARCQRLLSKKDHLQKKIAKIIYNEPVSREKVDAILTNQLLIDGLKNPIVDGTEDNSSQDTASEILPEIVCLSSQTRDDILAEHVSSRAKEAPKLVIKFGGEGRLHREMVSSSTVRQTDDGVPLLRPTLDNSRSSLTPNLTRQTDSATSSPRPYHWIQGEDSNSRFSRSMESPAFSNSSQHADTPSSGKAKCLSEAELAVQSILQ